jgi:hypothetical protein
MLTDTSILKYAFDEVPREHTVKAFGAHYINLPQADGGELYVTRHGWNVAEHILPENWFLNGRFHREGERLVGGTGLVYRLRISGEGEPRVELVVKICRFGEFVPLFMPEHLPSGLSKEMADNARFNGPFEEFGLIEELRRGAFGPPELRVRTKRPLAIYSPPEHFPLWQLGRTRSRFVPYEKALNADQARADKYAQVHLGMDRRYILLFGWVSGINAEDALEQGLLPEFEVNGLSTRVNDELAAKGFRILDNKPKHYILRRTRDGKWLRHHGKLAYVQVDFELLERTEAYQDWLKKNPGL